ncbi:Rieske 2Fe-2S domain-containing protein [uncultured Hyphomonas sp.]|uniref:Rieske 2Fe-2S domain-containing protein n=1 Tax=uncultured Hyphomonas sp. TaxID=225298 RepID=UPI002AAA8F3E|nr:Rieske 2Fe-2S domain-containing protein [uncultured Hyphomonas sp.]
MEDSTGYGRPQNEPDGRMTAVGPGSPMGELLRRYWQPVGLSADVKNKPVPTRILGEDLILFRVADGSVGLVESRCCHRGTTLHYGKVEENGIRCCYHGWLFDTKGHCLEMPCEPADADRRSFVRQPWYPVQEAHGVIFAYMGPPERMPRFRRFDMLEEQAANPDLAILASMGYGSGGHVYCPEIGLKTGEPVVDCNWLQLFENAMDPFHAYVLHMKFTGEQFGKSMGIVPEITWKETDLGVKSIQDRPLESDKVFRRITEVMLPNIRYVASVAVGERDDSFARGGNLTWVVPRDDTHSVFFSITTVGKNEDGSPQELRRQRFEGGRSWDQLSEEERRDMPGDIEAQAGQGPITIHRDEHLVTSDRGVMMLRKRFKRQLDAMANGADPLGVEPGEGDEVLTTEAGNYRIEKTMA